MMETERFDRLTRSVSQLLSRRALAATLGIAALGIADLAKAKKKRKRKKRKRVKFNDFGCVNVGNFCQNSDQCCSGICEGKRCKAHDADVCQGGNTDDFCGGTNIDCSAPANNDGLCSTTTGNAGYCVGDRKCFTCAKDADCQSVDVCGPDAACIVCANCVDTGGTACAALVPGGCA